MIAQFSVIRPVPLVYYIVCEQLLTVWLMQSCYFCTIDVWIITAVNICKKYKRFLTILPNYAFFSDLTDLDRISILTVRCKIILWHDEPACLQI